MEHFAATKKQQTVHGGRVAIFATKAAAERARCGMLGATVR